MATVRCAGYNVRVNLSELSDQPDRARIEAATTKQIAECGTVIREVIARIWALQGHS